MKLTTLHVLTGVGAVLTAVAVGVSTKLASDKVNEVREVRRQQDPAFEDLTGWEKFKIYARYEAAPFAMLTATCFGVYQCHKTAQDAIETAANVSSAVPTLINGCREVTKDAIGAKKEDELYSKAIEQKMKKNAPQNLIIGDGDCICMIISPGIDGTGAELAFISNATKIKEATLAFNNLMLRRASHSLLNDSSVSIAEWLDLCGVKTDNRILDHLGWTYQHDGVIDVSFRGGLTDDNKPLLGVEFGLQPHHID